MPYMPVLIPIGVHSEKDDAPRMLEIEICKSDHKEQKQCLVQLQRKWEILDNSQHTHQLFAAVGICVFAVILFVYFVLMD